LAAFGSKSSDFGVTGKSPARNRKLTATGPE
jgi:hypothetical protein